MFTYTTHHTVATRPIQYTESLLTFARTNEAFARHLYQATCHLSTPHAYHTDGIATPWYAVATEAAAVTRLAWLMEELPHLAPETYHEVVGRFVAFQKDYEPKALVLGIVGLAIIGPTLGLIKTKKKTRNTMRILVADTYLATASPAALARTATTLSTKLLAQELERAGGNAYRLEPDLAEWCFTDQQTEIATLPNEATLTAAVTYLQDNNLLYTALSSEEHLIGCALAPAIHESILDELGATRVSTDT